MDMVNLIYSGHIWVFPAEKKNKLIMKIAGKHKAKVS